MCLCSALFLMLNVNLFTMGLKKIKTDNWEQLNYGFSLPYLLLVNILGKGNKRRASGKYS